MREGWVFTHEDGEPLSPSYLTYKFNDLVEDPACLPYGCTTSATAPPR